MTSNQTVNKTKHFFNLCLLCFSIILFACSNPEPSGGHRYRTGNFTIVLNDDFEAKGLAGPTLENAKETFGYIGSSQPSVIHLNIKDADNDFALMYNTTFTGVDYGENESFKKHTIGEQVASLKEVLSGGEFEMMKLNGINVIKYSNNNDDGLYGAYYYLFDKTQVSFFVVIYPSSEPEWKKVEDAMFKSLKRADANGDYYVMDAMDYDQVDHIVSFCTKGDDTLTIDMHREFWETVDRNSGVPENLNVYGLNLSVEELMAEMGISFWEAYYEDALIAYRTGEFFESEKRKTSGAYIDSEEYEYRNCEIQKIANREPVLSGDEEIVVDEELIILMNKTIQDMSGTFRYNFKVLLDRDSFRNS